MASLRYVLLLASAACALGSIMIDEVETEKSWQHFKQTHNKVYYSLDEELYRRSVFESTLKEVFEHKLAYDRGEESYYLSINQFSDMPFDEFERTITCKNITSRRHASGSATPDALYFLNKLGSPPDSKDWMALGYVSPDVRNQNIGNCGGCYAFAATAAIESNYAIKHGLKNNVPNLSEQEIIDCGKVKAKFGLNGCAGGHPCGAYDFIQDVGGLATEKEYPWRKTQSLSDKCLLTSQMKLIGNLSGYYEHNDVTYMDKNLQIYVGLNGPATASVCANNKFQHYGGGVFDDANCFQGCKTLDNRGANHNLIAFGYDKDVFLLRNSWGKGWGIGGNMKIKRVGGKNTFGICGLGVDQSYPIVK